MSKRETTSGQLLSVLLVFVFGGLLGGQMQAQAFTDNYAGSVKPDLAAKLVFTHIPLWGSSGDLLQGQVFNVNPANYQVTLVILIEGLGWYSKSYCDQSLVHALPIPLNPDGTWSATITTGGVDPTAIKIAGYVIPKSYNPPCTFNASGLPQDVAAQSVAKLLVNRQNPRVRRIRFGGYTWWVKTNTVPLGPGPNNFSDSTKNIWVDANGYLHLKITHVGNSWYCPEIISNNVLGFGTNKWVLASAVDGLDPNVVLGLFTWSDTDSSYANREIDVEFSKFGNPNNPNNAQFTVQGQPGYGFDMPSGVPQSTSIMQWQPDLTYFETYKATDPSQLVAQWTYGGTSNPPGDQNVRMNLWLRNGAAPTNGQEVEVIIQAYSFAPYLGPRVLAFNPAKVVGGSSSTGTVTLYNSVPTGQQVTVSLTSSDPSVVSVPPTVTVHAGSKSVKFIAQTSPVAQPTIVTVTASANGGSTLATLTVRP
jgi:hypothetical protein